MNGGTRESVEQAFDVIRAAIDAEFGDQHSGLHLALASLESSLAPPNGIASHTGGVERKSRKARVMGRNKTSVNFSPPSFHFISFVSGRIIQIRGLAQTRGCMYLK